MDTKKKRFQLIIDPDILKAVTELAKTEKRSLSNMVVVLISEAIQARAKS